MYMILLSINCKCMGLSNNKMSFSLTVWAENADFCAKQYTGTRALKTDFTRYTESHASHNFL